MNENETLHFSEGAYPWRFLGLTLGTTWLLWIAVTLLGGGVPRWVTSVLHYAGGALPLIVAVALLYRKHDAAFRRDYWRRIVDFRRIGPAWYAIIFLFAPVKSLLAALVDVALGGQGIAPEEIAHFAEQPLVIVPTLIFWLIFGPIPEEPGWRGYALDGLEARRSALVSSLSVGLVWALWHLPLFFIAGTWQAESVGLGTQRFWFFMFSIVLESTLYTWIYNNTRRSTLSAILFHFVGNAFGQLFALSAGAEVYNFALTILSVVLVVALWGPRTLVRERGAAP